MSYCGELTKRHGGVELLRPALIESGLRGELERGALKDVEIPVFSGGGGVCGALIFRTVLRFGTCWMRMISSCVSSGSV